MTPTEQLFVDCLHQDPARLDAGRLAALAQPDWDALLEIARRQHVRPLIWRRLTASDVQDAVPVPVIEALAASRRAIAHYNLVLHAELGRLLAVLSDARIQAIVLKGMHLASAAYGNVASREIGDIDLLVRREHLERATSLVLGAGYAPAKPFDIDVDVAVSQHVTRLYKPPYLAVELHWNLTAPRRPQSMDPSSLWDRAQPFSALAGNAFALSLEDSVLHLCSHLWYQHRFEFGIRSLCDVAELARSSSPGVRWELVVRRAEEWHWARGVRLALRLATDLLGAAVTIPACPAWDAEPMSDAVLTDAATHLLAIEGAAGRPAGEVQGLMTPGASAKIRHVATVVRLTRSDLRQAYPGVAVTPWSWWIAYLLRCRDLLKRHTFVLLRMFVLREPAVRSAAARQQRLRQYLES